MLLVALVMVSLAVGSREIPLADVVHALLHRDPADDQNLVVWELRVPRTVLAVLTGAALGVAGVIMQAITRNPLADPGLLGVNAGAAVAVAVGISVFGVTAVGGYVWFALGGALLSSGVVYLLGRAHDAGTNPIRLVLAGAALTVVLGSVTSVLLISGTDTAFDDYRNWATGSLQGRGFEVLPVIAVATVLGLLLAVLIARPLDQAALGTELSTALGMNHRRTWIIAVAAVVVLAGTATAAAGPIGFVGLAAPHISRLLVGQGHRWLLPCSVLVAAIVMLAADVLGRVVVAPGEIGAGVMTALIGAPFFIALVRRRRVAKL
ncbi:iron ABC transporter permease [Mycetocola reblochoni]|uniref:Iron ABC transporter permease n=1 Tax=Mycetocola reblochoni TaxID=331618 RepID=A0A3L6ZUE4_9MICO|nr:iron ABC transporter permease [Mycetocola reblochoni]